MSAIRFEAKLFKPEAKLKTDAETLLRLPKDASSKLPSKGMTFVAGTINGSPLQAVLEPDGDGSHWFKVDETLRKTAQIKVGDMATLEIQPSKDWPEPKVPTNFKKALQTNSKAESVWQDITPMARWDWIRWIGAAKQAETRAHRVEVAVSKLHGGMRRPCCFNRTECTLTDA